MQTLDGLEHKPFEGFPLERIPGVLENYRIIHLVGQTN